MPGPGDNQPLTPQQRASWNNFLHFVNSKGYTGNADLDNRDQTLGESLRAEYNKTAGADSIPEGMISQVQQEFQHFKTNGNFPGNGDFGNFRRLLASQVKQKDISPVDGWFGSLTSQQAYPVMTDNRGHNWGTDYNSFIENMKDRLGQKYASK